MSRAPPKPSTRIYAILARKASNAVVFRRGPAKRVLTIAWDTETHEFRMGQWFKGRLKRRCGRGGRRGAGSWASRKKQSKVNESRGHRRCNGLQRLC